jgi:hypothetical protein
MIVSSYYNIPSDIKLPNSLAESDMILHDLALRKIGEDLYAIDMTLVVDDQFNFMTEITTDKELVNNWFGMFTLGEDTIKKCLEIFLKRFES